MTLLIEKAASAIWVRNKFVMNCQSKSKMIVLQVDRDKKSAEIPPPCVFKQGHEFAGPRPAVFMVGEISGFWAGGIAEHEFRSYYQSVVDMMGSAGAAHSKETTANFKEIPSNQRPAVKNPINRIEIR